MLHWFPVSLDRQLTRLRQGGRAAVLWSLRITAASVVGYVVALALFPGTQPLLAPLTAMLVVQVTPVSLLASGLDRVVAVLVGVGVAVAFAAVAPLEWWSLGLLIFLSLGIGQVLRLRDNLLEVPISGMLVLGVGALGAESFAWQRILETFVGAGVAVAVNLLFPPKVASEDASRAIDGVADSLSDLLTRAAADLELLASQPGDVASAARGWLGEARRITHDIPQAGAALLRAEQGRRFNVRAAVTPDVGPGLRQGLEALEHAAVAVRSMLRALEDATYDARWLDEESAPDVLLGLAQTFREMAAGVDAFGQLVRDEAGVGRQMGSADVRSLRDALEGLHEARARLNEMLLADIAPELVELHVTVLTTVKRLLGEMDLDARIRRQVRLVPRSRRRLPAPPSAPATLPGPERPEPFADGTTQVLPTLPASRPRGLGPRAQEPPGEQSSADRPEDRGQ